MSLAKFAAKSSHHHESDEAQRLQPTLPPSTTKELNPAIPTDNSILSRINAMSSPKLVVVTGTPPSRPRLFICSALFRSQQRHRPRNRPSTRPQPAVHCRSLLPRPVCGTGCCRINRWSSLCHAVGHRKRREVRYCRRHGVAPPPLAGFPCLLLF